MERVEAETPATSTDAAGPVVYATIPVLAGTAAAYEVKIGRGLVDQFPGELEAAVGRRVGEVVIVTDRNAWRHWGARVLKAFKSAGRSAPLVWVMPAGEGSKSRRMKERIEDWMLQQGCHRDAVVVAFGGGVVGDVAGFVAATFLRGVALVQVATTLMAMVDSSVGGKVAVDVPAGKNLVGAFHQPSRVYADVDLLQTLPFREWLNGAAEVVKTGCVWDEGLFAAVEDAVEELARCDEAPACPAAAVDPCDSERMHICAAADDEEEGAEGEGEAGSAGSVWVPVCPLEERWGRRVKQVPWALSAELVRRAVEIKAAIVTLDERDQGARALLNFGHTVGHAVEAQWAPRWLHGECVALGMSVEAEAARALGACAAEHVGRLQECLRRLGFATSVPWGGDGAARADEGELLEALARRMRADKKAAGAAGAVEVRCVLMERVGRARGPPFAHPVPAELLLRLLARRVAVTGLVRRGDEGAAEAVTVRPPGSKSVSNRLLLLAALAHGATRLRGLLQSDDTAVMLRALRFLGARARWLPDGDVLVEGVAGRPRWPARAGGATEDVVVDVGDAGTAARFLAAALCLLPREAGRSVVLDGDARMRQRPIGPLVEALRAQGADVTFARPESASLPLRIGGGGLRGGEVRMSGAVSSQFASAVLLAAPLADAPLTLQLLEDVPTSEPYIALTLDSMRRMGVAPDAETRSRFRVPLAAYRGPGADSPLLVEPDASAASYAAAWAAVTGSRVRIEGVGAASAQGDAAFAHAVLTRAGCTVRRGDHWTEVQGPPVGQLRPLGEIDMRDLTDTFLTAAVVAALAVQPPAGPPGASAGPPGASGAPPGASGGTTIRGIANQRVKECDRIAAMCAELAKCGVPCAPLPDGLWVGARAADAAPALRGAEVRCYNDHRVAMSMAVFGAGLHALDGARSLAAGSLAPEARAERAVVLDEPRCVDKTYPAFWDHLSHSLGAVVSAWAGRRGGEGPEAGRDSPAELRRAARSPDASVVLVGMRGAGKSSFGRALARTLGWRFVDLDEEFVRVEACESVSQFVAQSGWDAFRAREVEVLLSVAGAHPERAVLACGGGIVETDAGRHALSALADPASSAGSGWSLCADRHLVVFLDRDPADMEEDLLGGAGAATPVSSAASVSSSVASSSASSSSSSSSSSSRPAYAGGEAFASVWRRRLPLYLQCCTHHFVVRRGDRDWRALERELAALVRRVRAPYWAGIGAAAFAVAGDGLGGLLAASLGEGDDEAQRLQRRLAGLADPAWAAGQEGTFFLSLTSAEDEPAWLRDAAEGVDAIELRADLMLPPRAADGASWARAAGAAVASVRRACPDTPLIWTVRSAAEGGRAEGAEDAGALASVGPRLGCEWVDVEGRVAPAELRAVFRRARASGARVIVSAHMPAPWDGGAHVVRAAVERCGGPHVQDADCAGHGADVIKVVVGSGGSADLCARLAGVVRPLRASHAAPILALMMGREGVLSRVQNPCMTPVTHPRLAVAAAPGQRSALEIQALRRALGVDFPALGPSAAAPRLFHLLGKPVGASPSPLVHNAAFRALALPHAFSLRETDLVDDLRSIVREDAFGGAAVTIPLKEKVLPLVDLLSADARAIGAVNTLVRTRSGLLVGTNTDWIGIAVTLRRRLAERSARLATAPPPDATVLVLGAGGTARAAIFAAGRLGLPALVWNRTPERADLLAADTHARSVGNRWDDVPAAAVVAVVSTVPAAAQLSVPPALLATARPVVVELGYSPRDTALLQDALRHGCAVVYGIEILLEQALAQCALWTARAPPRAAMAAAIPAHLLPPPPQQTTPA